MSASSKAADLVEATEPANDPTSSLAPTPIPAQPVNLATFHTTAHGNNVRGTNGKRPSPRLSAELRETLEGYYAQGMTDWKAINERLVREHGEEFRFGSRAAFFRATKTLDVGSVRKKDLTIEEKAAHRRKRRSNLRLQKRLDEQSTSTSGRQLRSPSLLVDPSSSSTYHDNIDPNLDTYTHSLSYTDTMSKPTTALVLLTLSEKSLSALRSTFRTVHYHPSTSSDRPSASTLDEVDIVFGPPQRLGSIGINSLDQLPKLKYIQLGSAGADGPLASDVMKDWIQKDEAQRGRDVKLMTASGTHVLSIPPWAVGSVIMLYHQLPRILGIARNERRWANEQECDINGETYVARSLRGRTAGMLGYGALGRETARLLKSHGMRIIAANTSGKATTQDGYIIPGTGDKEGSLPESYHSTKDEKSFEDFLSQTDVLVASLPNTKNTAYLLDSKKLALLPPNALFVNFGRGNLVKSDDLIDALDKKDGLFGAALDVTDPEPLPDNHPLWTHPKVIVTPHISGNTEGEMDIATEICIENVRRIGEGENVVNEVDFTRGY